MVLFNGETDALYTVADWDVTEGKVSGRVTPSGKNAEDISLNVVRADPQKIEIVLKGSNWERTLSLYDERKLLERSRRPTRKQEGFDRVVDENTERLRATAD